MEEFIIIVIQFIVEVFWQAFIEIPFDFILPESNNEKPGRIGVYFSALIIGACVGGLTLLLASHSLFHSPVLRILNVVLSPLVSSFISLKMSEYRKIKKPHINPGYHAWVGFWFTLGLVLIRFAYAQH